MALSARSWTLAGRLRAALVGLSVVLLLAGLALVVVLRESDQALSAETKRAYPARVAASQLLTSLVDQETGLRGYALTHDDTFLDPYRKGLANEQQARAVLEELVPMSDPGRVALVTVDAAITAWRDQYASLRTAFTDDGDPVATIAFGRELFERVRQANAALDMRLAQQIDDAQREIDRDRQVTLSVLAGMALALVVAVVTLQRAMRSAVLVPMTALSRQVARVARGDRETPIEPSGPPDLQAMGEGVESMRLSLVAALSDLARRAGELARSNADLEQFDYVASHDLQEPLRKVASFCQLLEQRYSDRMDERGLQYIAFAVDGAKRMQQLINDLLTFSRVGRTSEGFVDCDLHDVVARSAAELRTRVAETEGQVDQQVAAGTVVRGDPTLLQMAVTNMLGNSLKYARDGVPPHVTVTASADEGVVRLVVADNGIGIPQEYADKVFVIFQRLHGRDEYGGTGIGLSLVKKVVEFHGGAVALEPSPLGGAAVVLTLPVPADATLQTVDRG